MKNWMLILAASTALVSSQAEGARYFFSRDGVYWGGFLGANFINNFKVVDKNANELQSRDPRNFKMNTGLAVGSFLGVQFCDSWRLEAEGAYRYNTTKGPHHGQHRHAKAGRYQLATALANLYLDLPRFTCLGIKPYVGAGIGYSWNWLKNDRYANFNGNGGAVAWQYIAGFSHPLGACYDYFFDFRYLSIRAFNSAHNRVNVYTLGIGFRRYW